MTEPRSEVLFLGGRAGSGKTSVASALHELLSARQVKHAVIEGDTLDLAWPPPWEHGLAATNLRALWTNYRALGYRRVIYTNVMSVLETDRLAAAMGDSPHVTAVLLDVSDDTMLERLRQRESAASLAAHLERNRPRRALLEQEAPAWVHRVPTDGRTLDALAAQLARLTGWVPDGA
ncbi:putative kinase [Deinococcus metalli]|uniref:ATPase n=1 Tax=Deinococcus metalli TaxID=1141878 RepID=A0A7W8KFC2_9DEIO|nr:adenylyl-sulfate kinase [Deinococcus metalli]MBB5375976.1 putative kinase [Deinococcus metalli]GHF41739.1 ATPase [Deinococcus metalli]